MSNGVFRSVNMGKYNCHVPSPKQIDLANSHTSDIVREKRNYSQLAHRSCFLQIHLKSFRSMCSTFISESRRCQVQLLQKISFMPCQYCDIQLSFMISNMIQICSPKWTHFARIVAWVSYYQQKNITVIVHISIKLLTKHTIVLLSGYKTQRTKKKTYSSEVSAHVGFRWIVKHCIQKKKEKTIWQRKHLSLKYPKKKLRRLLSVNLNISTHTLIWLYIHK